jgi:hypothetical protein
MMQIRLTEEVHGKVRSDLCRSHPYAYERIGFTFIKPVGDTIFVATGYKSIPDEFYIRDKTVGARVDHRAIAMAMKRTDESNEGVLHTHAHRGWGCPRFSRDDIVDHHNFLRSFRNANPHMSHGFLLLSGDKMMARVWLPGKEDCLDIFRYTIVGLPLSFNWMLGGRR